jgi:[ribosomal protein S5]-alanine N-acetyltransferase
VERTLTTLETYRLIAEPIGPAHEDELCVLLGDPRVGATLGGALSPPRVAAALHAKTEHWQRHGFGYWFWREKATGAPIGRGGLQRTHVGGRDEVEVGWAVMADRWGEGFATELGAAAVSFGFERLGLAEIVSYTLPTNRGSVRVMEKLGFEFEREVEHAGLPHVLYRLTTAVG